MYQTTTCGKAAVQMVAASEVPGWGQDNSDSKEAGSKRLVMRCSYRLRIVVD